VNRLKFTLKAWPVIAAATIGLCFLTQVVAKLFGIDLPDQQNVMAVRQCFEHAFDSGKAFLNCAVVVLSVVAIMPAMEEILFRWLLVMLPTRIKAGGEVSRPGTHGLSLIVVSSVLFSAAHYVQQPFPDTAFFALFFFGAAQCWLYFKTGRLWCPMLNHALFNLTNLMLLFVVPQ
jgi:hypothetical protein